MGVGLGPRLGKAALHIKNLGPTKMGTASKVGLDSPCSQLTKFEEHWETHLKEPN